MILICGIPSEPPLARVIDALQRMRTRYTVFNQRHFATAEMEFEIGAGVVSGFITLERNHLPLSRIKAVYTRLMDFRVLPEMRDVADGSAAFRHCAGLHDTLARWCEIAPARVVNRMAPMGSNSSKPYQAQLIQRYGFEVPETLITNDAARVLEFRERHKRIIYKSTSGVRSIVQMFADEDVPRLRELKWCPTQFQQYVEGVDVRVHVVGEQVFATRVESGATDYRYASSQVGEAAVLTATELSDEIADKCIRLTAGLGLAFAGIDLKLSPDGRVFCFEVNPSPGYSYFEANTGQPIARAVARYLAGKA